jgi:PAS domain S-box-containing protein
MIMQEHNEKSLNGGTDTSFGELIAVLGEAFAVVEPIPDDAGKPIDFIYRECNPAFETLAGSSGIAGKSGSEIHGADFPAWLEMYALIGGSETSLRFEKHFQQQDRWLDVRSSPISSAGGRRIALLFSDITARIRREAALHESEERLRVITDLVPDLIWSSDPHGSANWFNNRWFEYTGQRPEEALHWGWTATVHPDEREALARRYFNACTGNVPLREVHRIRRHDGEYRWFLLQVECRQDAGGTVIQCFGTATDIDDQRTALDELRESEEQLRVTTESAADYAIITLNIDGSIAGWSAGAERIFAYRPEETLGKTVHLIFTPEDIIDGAPEREMQTARTEGRAPDERWHLRRDGSLFFMSGVMRPIFNPDLRGYVKVARDMTEQKEAEERLRVSEERHRIALKSAEMGTWDWNIPAGTVNWNEQHFILLGLETHDTPLELDYFFNFLHHDDRDSVSEQLRLAAQELATFQADFRILRAGTGSECWMHGYGRVIEQEGGKPTRMVGVIYDVTEAKALEQQKDAFLSVASHELRTPVTAMKAYSEVLRDMLDEQGDSASVNLVQKLDAQIDRLTDLIRTLLDVTRIRQGQLDLRVEHFDLAILLTEVKEEIQLTIPQVIRIPQLPAAIVTGDRERIRQVVTNLLSNASSYSPEHAPITITLSSQEHTAQVCIEDAGIGISPELQAKIFDRYFRAQPGDGEASSGLGLGLFIASDIIGRHQGQIWVASTPGEGSSFCFTLPLAAPGDESFSQRPA